MPLLDFKSPPVVCCRGRFVVRHHFKHSIFGLYGLLVLLFSLPSGASEAPLLALMQDSQPKYFDTTSSRQGLCNRVYQQLAERLERDGFSLRVEPGFVPIKRLLKMVEQGSADLFCGAGRNAERESRFVYLKTPVYHTSNVVLAHSAESFAPMNFADLAEVQNSVAIVNGTSSGRFLIAQGVHKPLLYDDVDQAIRAVAGNPRVRFFYYHDLGLKYALHSYKLPIQVVPVKYRTVPQWVIVSRHLAEPKREALERALAAMAADGSLATIRADYLVTP